MDGGINGLKFYYRETVLHFFKNGPLDAENLKASFQFVHLFTSVVYDELNIILAEWVDLANSELVEDIADVVLDEHLVVWSFLLEVLEIDSRLIELDLEESTQIVDSSELLLVHLKEKG